MVKFWDTKKKKWKSLKNYWDDYFMKVRGSWSPTYSQRHSIFLSPYNNSSKDTGDPFLHFLSLLHTCYPSLLYPCTLSTSAWFLYLRYISFLYRTASPSVSPLIGYPFASFIFVSLFSLWSSLPRLPHAPHTLRNSQRRKDTNGHFLRGDTR